MDKTIRHSALLKNERLKLYKKPSTWILTGIILAITLLTLVLTKVLMNSYSTSHYSWQQNYAQQIEAMANDPSVDEDSGKGNAQSGYIDSLRYLLEHDIPPEDWRTDAVMDYFNLKASAEDLQAAGASAVKEQEQAQALLAQINSNNWRGYIQYKIAQLKSNNDMAQSPEVQVDIEIFNMYLDYNVVPVSISMGMSGGSSNDGSSDNAWKCDLLKNVRTYKQCLLRGVNNQESLLTHSQRVSYQKDIDVAIERLVTNTPPVEENSCLGLLENSTSSLELISLLLIVFAGGIVATEFNNGTIKLLLITPHKRQRIFWAKATLLLEITLIATGGLFVLCFLVSGLLTGFAGIGAMQVLSVFGSVIRIPYLLYLVLRCLLMLLPVLAYGALSLMLSTVTRKSAVAIALTLLLMFGSNIVVQILLLISFRMVIPGVKFLFFVNTSLANYLPSSSGSVFGADIASGQFIDSTMTLGFSVAVLIVYTLCFLWIARDSFCRRDIK